MNSNTIEREQINSLLIQTDEYVRHEYLSVLDCATPVEISSENPVGTNMQIMHLLSFSYSSNDNIIQKIQSVYGAIEKSGNTAALILDGRKDRIDLYLGMFTKEPENISSAYKVFINSFNGVFPGSRYINVKNEAGKNILEELLNAPVDTSIAAVSAFPLHHEGSRTDCQGLEILIDGMRNRPFTMILLAEAINRAELVQMRQGFESLYTQIAPLQKQDFSISTSKTDTFGVNFSKSVADSLNISSGFSIGHTDTHGTSQSVQLSPDNEEQRKSQAANQLLGSAVAVASVLTLGPEGIAVKKGVNILQSLFFGQTLSNLFNNVEVVADKDIKPDRQSRTEGEHNDTSDSTTVQGNRSQGKTVTEGEGVSKSLGMTEGETMQISCSNKSVTGLLERIENHIQEIMRLESEGAYRVASYFIAGDEETAISAASLYRSIVTAGMPAQVNSPVYHWGSEKGKEIMTFLQKGIHPLFAFEQYPQFPYISAAQPIGLSDLPYYLCLPQKSVFGLDVAEHAAFSRDILTRDSTMVKENDSSVYVGNVYHMGKEIKATPVFLNTNMLTSHLFVAGATGSGKSNFCYQLLDNLLKNEVKTLIIEPAKGEYARVFGGRDDFKVYGTNLRLAPPLRINPFAFPAGVTSSEHIERLLAIFNAAWPMYSAMPAIMKDALEEIYRRHGFDDILGDLPENGEFPTFSDLLEVLPEIIKRSEYSAEVQGNYIGALVTRVKSLTNGVYSIIFSADEIGDKGLFDENVIIDISRIGSSETKALIMGFLITRLAEYRTCSGRMNSGLEHITLLEEAHHLLGKTSGTAGQDVGNMMNASVQMLSDAIREMRTYGEGFIIADQSPSVMDSSVIANTQTKVFFMMPRREDRLVASDAMSLETSQTDEIAKLPKGVAVIFQNEWSSAVLCKIGYFSTQKYIPFSYVFSPEKETKELLTLAARILIVNGSECNEYSLSHIPALNDLRKISVDGYGLGQKRKLVFDIIKNSYKYTDLKSSDLKKFYTKLFDLENMMKRYATENTISGWSAKIETEICRMTNLIVEEAERIVHVYLFARAKENRYFKKLYVAYLTYKKN